MVGGVLYSVRRRSPAPECRDEAECIGPESIMVNLVLSYDVSHRHRDSAPALSRRDIVDWPLLRDRLAHWLGSLSTRFLSFVNTRTKIAMKELKHELPEIDRDMSLTIEQQI